MMTGFHSIPGKCGLAMKDIIYERVLLSCFIRIDSLFRRGPYLPPDYFQSGWPILKNIFKSNLTKFHIRSFVYFNYYPFNGFLEVIN